MSTISLIYILAAIVFFSIGFAVIGIYSYNSQSTNISDSNNHVAMSGVALAYLLAKVFNIGYVGIQILMIIFVLVFVNTIVWLKNNKNIRLATLIQIQTGIAGAITAIVFSFPVKIGVDLHSFLFGNIIVIDWPQLIVIAIASCLFLAIYFLNYKKILIINIDRVEAKTRGINPHLYDHILISLMSVVSVVVVQYVGGFLIGITLSMPLISSLVYSTSQINLHKDAVMFSLITNTLGFIISLIIPVSASALMVITQIIGFIIINIYFSIKNNKLDKQKL